MEFKNSRNHDDDSVVNLKKKLYVTKINRQKKRHEPLKYISAQ